MCASRCSRHRYVSIAGILYLHNRPYLPILWPYNKRADRIFLSFSHLQLAKSCVIIKATVIAEGGKMEAMSCPIKVVSKPEQIRKKRKEANQDPELDGSKKRARSEDVLVELRQLQSVLAPAVEALKQQHRMRNLPNSNAELMGDDASLDMSDDTFADEDAADDFESTTNITTDDERTGEPNSLASFDDESSVSAVPYTQNHARNDASLTATFENMLTAFDEALAEEQQGEAQNLAHVAPIDRLKATVNFLGLDQSAMMDTDDYH